MRVLALLSGVLLLSLSTSASAISLSIDGSTCGSCEGADLFIDIVGDATGFDVTLTINSDNYSGPKDGLVQVGFGGISGWSSVSLVDSPVSSTVAWSNAVAANINSSSLCGNGASTGKVCTSGFVDITSGGDYTWQFRVTGGTAVTDVSGIHIGGQFADVSDLTSRRGPRGHVISESGPAIPEPSAAMLFGVGALLVSRLPRKRR